MKTMLFFFLAVTVLVLQGTTQTVKDKDGNSYLTIVIGKQEWLKENLRATRYQNGLPIPNVTGKQQWATLTGGARCYYNNDSMAYEALYGALYNWYVVNDTGHICPLGWHVPSHKEWLELENFLGGWEIAGGKLKEAGTLHWKTPNGEATNSTGFTGLPGGMRGLDNSFEYMGENGLWWTSTESETSAAWSRYQWYMQGVSDANPVPKNMGLSIRCIRDYPVGLGQVPTHPDIHIYPNPSRGQLTIDMGGRHDFTLHIYNSLGKTMMHQQLTHDLNVLEIDHLARGLYLVKISGKATTLANKLIVE